MANAFDKVSAEKIPGLSFKGLPVNHKEWKLRVVSDIDEAQSRNFDTDEPDFYPAKPGQAQGDPIMCAVFAVEVVDGPQPDVVGEKRNIWATISRAPGSMFQAIAAAQTAAGEDIGPGGTLYLQQTGEAEPKNPKHNKRKLYTARYESPSKGNAFGSTQASSNDSTPPF